jgi:hypothetical protein
MLLIAPSNGLELSAMTRTLCVGLGVLLSAFLVLVAILAIRDVIRGSLGDTVDLGAMRGVVPSQLPTGEAKAALEPKTSLRPKRPGHECCFPGLFAVREPPAVASRIDGVGDLSVAVA